MPEAQTIIAGLVQRGYPLHIAQGIAANMRAESNLNPGINEIAPLVEGSRGGFGLNQWTGPRRIQLEEFAQMRGTSPDDLQTQLDFTDWELRNTESRAGEALRGAGTSEEAARIYSEQFLRPGIPNMENRLAYAHEYAGIMPGEWEASRSQQPQANRLAALQSIQPRLNYLDPAAFMNF